MSEIKRLVVKKGQGGVWLSTALREMTIPCLVSLVAWHWGRSVLLLDVELRHASLVTKQLGGCDHHNWSDNEDQREQRDRAD